MENGDIEKNIYQSGTNLLQKLNLFTIFHAVWLIEMYYLGVNTLFNYAIYLDPGVPKKIPIIVLKYNEVILAYFTEYYEFVYLVALGVFICGICIAIVKVLPVFGKYRLIKMYSDYGVYSGLWLFIIFVTYKMYIAFKIGFLFSPMLVFIFVELLKKFNNYLEEKTGITFLKQDDF